MADPRTRTSPARFLAPLALIAVIVAFFAILSESGGGGSSSPGTQSSQTTSSTSGSKTSSSNKSSGTTTTARAKKQRRNYTVKVGDTFGTIASKTGVSVETLQTLNPAVDPHSMTVGQRIRLR